MVIAGLIAIPAALVTFIVNRVPDPGTQVALFMAFGFLFGLPWALREIRAVFGGLIIGVFLGILVVVVDGIAPSMTGPEAALLSSIKWLVPISTLTVMASVPLLSGTG